MKFKVKYHRGSEGVAFLVLVMTKRVLNRKKSKRKLKGEVITGQSAMAALTVMSP